MTKRSILAPLALAAALALPACSESSGGSAGGSGGSAGVSGSGGSAGSGGQAGIGGNGGMGGMVDDDCSRICESPCVEAYLPIGTVDDCIRACRMGFFECIPELIAALQCIEMVSCDVLADSCLGQSEALTMCLGGGG